MVISDRPNMLLYIEPQSAPSAEPLIDEATRKMAAAFRAGVSGTRWRGVHTCSCGVWSSNTDYKISELQTNSLCVHYLAFHRGEVPVDQLERVMAFEFGEAEPSEKELAKPKMKTMSSGPLYRCS